MASIEKLTSSLLGTCYEEWYHSGLTLIPYFCPEHVSDIQVMQCSRSHSMRSPKYMSWFNAYETHTLKTAISSRNIMVDHNTSLPAITNYMDCVAQSDRDPDMQGFAVRLSTFIANICLAILIKYSSEDVIQAVGVVLLQVYSILLVTFISMWRNNLHIADAHFALSITISPLTLYFLWTTARHFMGKESTLYERMARSRITIASLILVMVLLWIVLYCLIYFGTVINRGPCSAPTFSAWVFFQVQTVKLALNWSVWIIPWWPFFYLVYALRHYRDICREYRRHMKKIVKWRRLVFVQTCWFDVRSFWLSQWVVITYSHPWFVFLGVVICYLTWAGSLRLWVLDMNRFYHALLVKLHGTWEESPPSSYDALGFGQLLAVTIAIEPLFQVLKLSWENRWELVSAVRCFPSYCWEGIVFLFAGRRNPWRIIQDGTAQPSTMHPHPKRRVSELGPRKYEREQSIDSMDDEASAYLLPTHSFGSWDSQSPHSSGLYGRPSRARNQSVSSDSSYQPLLGRWSAASESTTSFVASPQALPPTPHSALARQSFHMPHGHSRTHSDIARQRATPSHGNRPRAQSSVESFTMSSPPLAATHNDTSRPFMGSGWVHSSSQSHRLSEGIPTPSWLATPQRTPSDGHLIYTGDY